MAGQRLKDLVVRIRANTAEFQTRMEKAAATTEAVGRRMESVGSDLSLRLSVPLIAAGGAALKMAADAQESENLFTVAMGNMGGAARDFSERLRTELGLNAYAVRQSVGTFNQMLSSMGLAAPEAYRLSTSLTQLSTDLESFFNLRPGEGFQKLQSGISGEAEPLKRLGILVTENVVKQTALRHGLISTGQEMTEAQKVLARYIAIVEQTANAQGDLARTGDSPLNMFRRLRSSAAQAAITFGEGLIPAAGQVAALGVRMASHLQQWAERFKALDDTTRAAIVGVAAFAAAIGPVLVGIGAAMRVVGGLHGALTLLTNPVGIAVAAIGTLTFAGITLVRNWDVVKLRMVLAWTAIKDSVFGAVGSVLDVIERLTERIPFVGDKVRELREGFDDLANASLAESNDRILQLEREINANFTPAVAGATASVDEFKLSIEGLKAAFAALGGGEQGGAGLELAQPFIAAQKWVQISSDQIQQTYFLGLHNIRRGMREHETATERATTTTETLAAGIASSFQTAGTSFRDFAANFMRQLKAMIARLLVFRALASIFAPFAGGTSFGAALFSEFSRYGGARAAGGPILPGRTYLVGERGPELIESRASGVVRPIVSGAAPAPAPTFVFDASRLPPARDPLQAARDADWIRLFGETMRAWEANGGRLRYAGA